MHAHTPTTPHPLIKHTHPTATRAHTCTNTCTKCMLTQDAVVAIKLYWVWVAALYLLKGCPELPPLPDKNQTFDRRCLSLQ